MGVTTIIKVADVARARILISALRAHGFHPVEGTDPGIPAMGGMSGPTGVVIQVPNNEVEDARVLAEALQTDLES